MMQLVYGQHILLLITVIFTDWFRCFSLWTFVQSPETIPKMFVSFLFLFAWKWHPLLWHVCMDTDNLPLCFPIPFELIPNPYWSSLQLLLQLNYISRCSKSNSFAGYPSVCMPWGGSHSETLYKKARSELGQELSRLLKRVKSRAKALDFTVLESLDSGRVRNITFWWTKHDLNCCTNAVKSWWTSSIGRAHC